MLQVILKEKVWGTGSGNPTELEKVIGDGYFVSLEAASGACARHHVFVSVPPVLNTSPSQAGRGSWKCRLFRT